ncbi:Adenosylcobalamin biosynthesis bifunctional protein CobDQ [Trichinella spiralis]|uniref:Adenosylcobalamin biosynthesis bifunctional protein CobDQ n=1 Tax=Trichinella spiralis TaxID=6334 RepID=A0ABR3KCP5_TRISP
MGYRKAVVPKVGSMDHWGSMQALLGSMETFSDVCFFIFFNLKALTEILRRESLETSVRCESDRSKDGQLWRRPID